MGCLEGEKGTIDVHRDRDAGKKDVDDFRRFLVWIHRDDRRLQQWVDVVIFSGHLGGSDRYFLPGDGDPLRAETSK